MRYVRERYEAAPPKSTALVPRRGRRARGQALLLGLWRVSWVDIGDSVRHDGHSVEYREIAAAAASGVGWVWAGRSGVVAQLQH